MKYHKEYGILAFCIIILFNYSCILQASESLRLKMDDLTDFKKVIEYRDRASKESKEQSRSFYEHALAHDDSGSSAKLLLEGIFFYPGSRAYYKFVEYRLKQLRYKENEIKLIILDKAMLYSNMAVKLNNVDSMLSKAEVKTANNNIICIKKYLDTKKIDQGCKALEWNEVR